MMTLSAWILISIQLVLGLFDIVYHHELTERIAWKRSQRKELRLHAARNFIYTVVLLGLGWFVLHGVWAWLLIVLLVSELLVTLADFVEEDRSRLLPATERVTHTLLALNFGAILALLSPTLMDWASQDTAVRPISYGFWSVLASLAALGTAIFGAREFAAAARLRRLRLPDASALAEGVSQPWHVLVTGGTGFIGQRLIETLVGADCHVTILTRDPSRCASLSPPFSVVTDLAQLPDDAVVDAIINLAGEPIANGLWTRRKRFRILRSRMKATREVARLIERLETPPEVLIQASAVGWYGLRDQTPLSETSQGEASFCHRVCDLSEQAAMIAQEQGVRVAQLRIGLVLGTEGGLLASLLIPFEFGLGGPIGGGSQFMSWIERDDLVRLIVHVLEMRTLSGPINATAPVPVTNAKFSRALGYALNRPAMLPLPAAPLRFIGGAFAQELLLGGQNVLPRKALGSGFAFQYDTIDKALCALIGSAEPRRPDIPLHTSPRFFEHR